MKNSVIIYIFLFLLSINTVYSQSGWVPQNSGISTRLYSVYFTGHYTGWASGDSGVILNTTNGGTNWSRQISGTTYPLLSIMFADENTGWASGGYDDFNPLCYNYRIILKTTNGGANWITQLTGGLGYFFNDLSVVNDQTAFTTSEGVCCPPFCIQSAGSVTKTDNAGLNWFGVLGDAFYSVFFLNDNEGWAAGQSGSDVLAPLDYIYKTNNSGNNWQLILNDTAFNANPFRNVFFVNAMTGYSIKGKLLKTTDGGFNWINADSISTQSVTDNCFINSDTGWCTGWNGKIIRTDNGGINWSIQSSNTTEKLNSIHFTDELYGWAVGSGGTIVKTSSGGLTSIKQNQTSEIPDYHLSQNYPNPFNPTTSLEFGISDLGFITLKVSDVLGNEIETLVNENLSPGSYEVKWNGERFASGIYFYSLTAGGKYIGSKRMILIK